MNLNRHMVSNTIITPDGTVLISQDEGHSVSHYDKNGEWYFNSGGIQFPRRSINKIPFDDIAIYDDDNFALIRLVFCWGTYGKSGREPLRWVRLFSMTDEHIRNIIITQIHLTDFIKSLFVRELLFRHQRSIVVKDKEEIIEEWNKQQIKRAGFIMLFFVVLILVLILGG